MTARGRENEGGGREKRRRNTKFSSCRRWREKGRWNFYNDTFCARDYFRDVPAGFEGRERSAGRGTTAALLKARPRFRERRAHGNEFACRLHVLPTFFLLMQPAQLMRKTCCENLRTTEVYYFRLLIRATTATRRQRPRAPSRERERENTSRRPHFPLFREKKVRLSGVGQINTLVDE